MKCAGGAASLPPARQRLDAVGVREEGREHTGQSHTRDEATAHREFTSLRLVTPLVNQDASKSVAWTSDGGTSSTSDGPPLTDPPRTSNMGRRGCGPTERDDRTATSSCPASARPLAARALRTRSLLRLHLSYRGRHAPALG